MTRASIAIPTSGRPDYLAVTLASIAPQAAALGAEVIVVSDGGGPETAELAARYRARLIEPTGPGGLNAARNTAIAAARSDLIIFSDDDVSAPDGWLAAILAGAAAHPGYDVFGGPITPHLIGGPPHCGQEPAPITSLDLGPEDCDARYVWGANLALRRSAIERIGSFDERLGGRGDEEEWLDRLAADGGRVRYLAAAGLEHRRIGSDTRLTSLAMAGYRLGASARANDVRKGAAPPLTHELRDLAGAGWHLVARRCAYGAVFAAHSVGRIQELLWPRVSIPAPVAPGVFASGESGYVAGVRAVTQARARDARADVGGWLASRRLARDAAAWGRPRQVLVAAVERASEPNILDAALAELRRSHHQVRTVRTDAGDRGRFDNFNAMIAGALSPDDDWLVLIDDDVRLPPGFLDAFLFLAERFDLTVAQPAHRAYSHAGWAITRRRRGVAVRETRFVEIGPVVAFQRRSFDTLLPFPSLQVGWGVDAHWGAVARDRGWRIGVIDATAVEHALRPVAASYDMSSALAESAAFLAEHPHISVADARQTVASHRIW